MIGQQAREEAIRGRYEKNTETGKISNLKEYCKTCQDAYQCGVLCYKHIFDRLKEFDIWKMNIDLKVRNARYVKCPQVEDGTMILEHRASLYSHSQGEYIMMWVVQSKVGHPEHKTLCAGAYADISILVNNC